MHKIYALALVALLGVPYALRAQTTQELFGKNRVQYQQFAWKQITTTNFDIYFYQGGNEAAYQAARYAEADFDRIADLLGYTPYSKTKIFLYNSLADLQQSNVGLSNDDVLTGGQTSFVKSQVEIPFNGNQVTFKRDLSNNIAQVFISEMMFGGSLKDMLQSSLLLSLPDWFMAGAAAYVAEGWSLEMDDYLRDAVLSKNIRKPSAITGDRATLVGQSIWNYIAERYGKANISNILNLTRIIRNEETSIASTLGVRHNRFLQEWKQYYTDMASEVSASYVPPQETFRVRKQNRRGILYNQLAISPDGRYLAYSENSRGVYRVKVMDTETKRKKTLFRGGYRVVNQRVNQQLPLLAWQNNRSLAIVTVERSSNKFYVYEVTKGRRKIRKTLDNFDEVLDFDVSDDGSTMVLSADQAGQSDIFLYNIARSTTRQLTNDLYDDLQPHFLAGSAAEVVFSSNRPSDSLSAPPGDYRTIQNDFSLYLYNAASASTLRLQRLVTSLGNATHPVVADQRTIFYLDDEKGIHNLYRYDLTTKATSQVSNFRQGIRTFDLHYAGASQALAYQTLSNSREYIGFIRPFDFNRVVDPVFTKRNELQEDKAQQLKTEEKPTAGELSETPARNGEARTSDPGRGAAIRLEPGEVDTDNYQFDSDVANQEEKPAAGVKSKGNILLNNARAAKKENIAIRGPFPYQSRFTTNNVTSSLLINPITGWGIQFDVNMNDMLEDHVVRMGGLLNTDLRSNNFYGEYRYLKRRIDYGVRFDRKQIFINNEGFPQKYRLNQVMVSAAYPFSVSSRFTVAPFYTGTRFLDVLSLPAPTPPLVSKATTDYGGVRLEYVFDNTLVNGMNMIEGTRMKVRFDQYAAFQSAGESFNRFTVDLRNYKKIHRDLIFATRLAYGHSGGQARKRFLLGGMDNWLFNSRESGPSADLLTTSRDTDRRDFYFLEFVSNLRGFGYAKLGGYNHLLLNAELRLPLIKYFYRGPITSNFLKNLQLVAFTDVGTAWNQQSPLSRRNDQNTVTLPTSQQLRGNPFTVTVTNFKNPFLTGYGAGVRTFLLGYYVKFDAAWGVEDYVAGPTRYYLTLGYDF
ncbi:MAG: hypothetical protein H7Z75_16345 [Ferruginibacter sp.]|nr:hypothetical protein [Cytophagales bacterium]